MRWTCSTAAMSTALASCRATATSSRLPSASAKTASPCYGFGTTKTPVSFQQACTRFFDVGALAIDEAEALEQPEASEGQRHVDAELLADPRRRLQSLEARRRRVYASLSEVGQRANAVSSFAVRNYGFSRLSDLIKAVPNFEVKAGADGRLAVKRLR